MGPMKLVPLDDIAYAAALLFIKPPFGCCKMGCGPGALCFVPAAEHERIQFQEKPQIAHCEQVEALGEQAVHELIASHHICHDAGVHRFAARFKCVVYLRETGLQRPQRGLDCIQIQDLSRSHAEG